MRSQFFPFHGPHLWFFCDIAMIIIFVLFRSADSFIYCQMKDTRHLILMHFDKLWCFCVIVVLMNMLTQFNHVENGFTKYTRRNYNDESMAKTIFYNFLLDILYASLVLFFFFYIFTNIHYFSTTKTELQFSTTSQSVIRLLCFTDHFVCLPVKKSSLITTARSVCVWNCTTTGLTEAVLYVL